MIEIRTEYEIQSGGQIVGYVIRREDPAHFYVRQDFGPDIEWVVFKKVIPLFIAIEHKIVRRPVLNTTSLPEGN